MQTLEGVKEQEAEIDTSGQDVQKSEPEKQELETSDYTLEDGDEIIDLGDEKEQVLADMRKSLEIGEETELASGIFRGDDASGRSRSIFPTSLARTRATYRNSSLRELWHSPPAR